MTGAEKEKAIRDYVAALEKQDIEQALTFFSDDAEWITTSGTFKGKAEIKKYTEWMLKSLPDMKFIDDGIGIIEAGDTAVYQHVFEANYQGKRVKAHSICTYAFSEDKCRAHATIVDRLSMAEQAASGLFAKRIVKTIISKLEKGLN
jgi:ketosteroid isomerase-like protein